MEIIKDVIGNYLDNAYGLGKYTLDVGTGSANMALTLAEMGIRCITIEKSRNAFAKAKDIIHNAKIELKPLLLKMDARKMTFHDDTFDYVIAYKSMHHIENAKKALDEMLRVCKCGGKIIIIEHKKDIRMALDLLTVNRGEEHPKHIDIETVYQELSQKEGEISLLETNIGVMCIFKKHGNKRTSPLDITSSNIQIGNIEDKYYYFNSISGELSFLQNDKTTPVEIQKENHKVLPARSICLNLANKCNLNCTYCYADGGNYGQDETIMSTDVALKGIDWFSSYTKTYPHIILFGGEPLINKSTIEDILKNNGKNLTYSINTNSTLLEEEILRLLIQNDVKISISIDGTRETHDSQRIFKNGAPTYDNIIKKLQNLPETIMKRLWARITITNNSSSIYDEIISLLDMGFTKIDMSFVSGNKDFSENEKILDLWMKDIDRLASLSIEKWLNNEAIIYPFVKVFQSLLYGQDAQQTCTAGREMLSLQPDESLVPCFKFNDFLLGNLESGIDSEKVAEFEQYKEIMRNLICNGCWVYKLCGGLCPKDLPTVINIQEHRCQLIQQLVRSSLLYFSDCYVNSSQRFREQNLYNKMSQWLKKIKDNEQ